MVVLLLGGVYLAYLALAKIGIGNIVNALVNSSPTFVVLALARDVLGDGHAWLLLGRDPQSGAAPLPHYG